MAKRKHDWEGLPRIESPSLYHNAIFVDWCKECGALRFTRQSKGGNIYQTIKLPESVK